MILRRAGVLVLGAMCAAAIGACNACLGLTECEEPARIAVDGQVLRPVVGAPIPGVSLTLVASADGVVSEDSTVTDSQGVFSLTVPWARSSVAKVSLRVAAPGYPAYVIDSLNCRPVTRRGDGCVLRPLRAAPQVPSFAFRYRNDSTRPVKYVRVTFERTGGSSIVGAGDRFVAATDSDGVAQVFPFHSLATGMDPIIGTLTLELPAPIGTTVRNNYRIYPSYTFEARPPVNSLAGPSLSYAMVFSDSVTQLPVAGVEVTFTRTGGIETRTQTSKSVSDIKGVAVLGALPLTVGTVVGDFSIVVPRFPGATSIPAISLPTFDADTAVVLSRWRIGATGKLSPGGI